MENASIGWIVQMRLKSSSNPNIVVPHTAIISAKDATGFYFLDSNWANDNKVQNHRLNYVDFYAKLFGQGQYSLYYIQ